MWSRARRSPATVRILSCAADVSFPVEQLLTGCFHCHITTARSPLPLVLLSALKNIPSIFFPASRPNSVCNVVWAFASSLVYIRPHLCVYFVFIVLSSLFSCHFISTVRCLFVLTVLVWCCHQSTRIFYSLRAIVCSICLCMCLKLMCVLKSEAHVAVVVISSSSYFVVHKQ